MTNGSSNFKRKCGVKVTFPNLEESGISLLCNYSLFQHMDLKVLSLRSGVPCWGRLDPPVLKKCFKGGPGGPNYSTHSKRLVQINIRYFDFSHSIC